MEKEAHQTCTEDREKWSETTNFVTKRVGVSSGSEEEDGRWEESEDEADAECLYCAGLFTEDDGVEV